MEPKKFKDFGIKSNLKGFIGDKVKMDKILNREIIVSDYKIEDSTKKPGTKYLTMQITINGSKHVLFTGSKHLMDMIQQIPMTDFPFVTTIIKENDTPQFS